MPSMDSLSKKRTLAFVFAVLVAGGCEAPRPPASPGPPPPTPTPPVQQPTQQEPSARPPTPAETEAAAWRKAEAEAKALAAKGDYDAALAVLRHFLDSAMTDTLKKQAIWLHGDIYQAVKAGKRAAERARQEQAARARRKTYDEEMAKGRRLARSHEIADVEAGLRAFEAAMAAADDDRPREDARRAARDVRQKRSYLEHMLQAEEADARGDYEEVLRLLWRGGRVSRRYRELRERARGQIAKAAGLKALESGDAETAVKKLEEAESYGIDVSELLARARKARDAAAEPRSSDER
jgi:hypothetical protein